MQLLKNNKGDMNIKKKKKKRGPYITPVWKFSNFATAWYEEFFDFGGSGV